MNPPSVLILAMISTTQENK
ncbi:hypothetical protein [Enterobacter soli]